MPNHATARIAFAISLVTAGAFGCSGDDSASSHSGSGGGAGGSTSTDTGTNSTGSHSGGSGGSGAGGSGGGGGGGGGGSVTHATANLWIDTHGGSCTRQATAGAYVAGKACASMQAAMTAAQTDDVVVMKCGTYPSQSVTTGTKSGVVSFYAETYDEAKTAFDAYAATTCATVADLSLDGVDRIHVYGIQATPAPDDTRTDAKLTYAHGGSLDICDNNCKDFTTKDILVDGFHGRSAFIRATNVIIDHGSFGGWDACYDTNGNHLASGDSGTEDGFRFWDGTGGSTTPTDSIVRHSVFHDIIMGVNGAEEDSVCTFGSDNGPHADCMQNNGGDGITVEANVFFNCPSSDIQWNPFGGATVGTQLIQNNYFGPIDGIGNGTVLGAQGSGSDCSHITVRNNFYGGSQGINPGGSPSGCTDGSIQVYGNIFRTGGCIESGTNYHDNLFVSGSCGAAAKTCTPSFVDAPPTTEKWLGSIIDPHLASGDTCAKGADMAALFPADDIDGHARPIPAGSKPDFGPDEIP